MESPPIYRPTARRPFDLSSDLSPLPSSSDFPPNPDSGSNTPTSDGPPKRSRSAVSLTSSTLFGIYSRGYSDEINTPLQLSRNPSAAHLNSLRSQEEEAAANYKPREHGSQYIYPVFRVASLFVFGAAYGLMVTHLHDRSAISPASTTGIVIDLHRFTTRYLFAWGAAGIVLGNILPWLDQKVDGSADDSGELPQANGKSAKRRGSNGASPERLPVAKRDWSPAVRSIGAFVGIAYAIRRLPWQSTLQVSLTLALVNPFLWFIVDRTRSGFWFSTLVALTGTAAVMQVTPDMIKTPETRIHSEQSVAGLVSVETIAVSTWIASVLFCSCVCFGSIGRKLAVEVKDAR